MPPKLSGNSAAKARSMHLAGLSVVHGSVNQPTVTTAEITNILLKLYSEPKHSNLNAEITRLRKASNRTGPWLSRIFLILSEKFTQTQEDSLKTQILGLARYILNDVDPNYRIAGLDGPTLLMKICSEGVLEFLSLLIQESKTKPDLNYSCKMEGLERVGIETVTVFDVLITDELSSEKKLKILDLFLVLKPKLPIDKFLNICARCELSIVKSAARFVNVLYFNLEKDLSQLATDCSFFHLNQRSDANVLTSALCRKGFIKIKIPTTADSQLVEKIKKVNIEAEKREKESLEILDFLLNEIDRQSKEIPNTSTSTSTSTSASANHTLSPNPEKIALAQKIKDYALIAASIMGNDMAVKRLLAAGANVFFTAQERIDINFALSKALTAAVFFGHYKVCNELLKALKILESQEKEDKEKIQILKDYALRIAIRTYQPAIVLLLLESGARQNYRDEFCEITLKEFLILYYNTQKTIQQSKMKEESSKLTPAAVTKVSKEPSKKVAKTSTENSRSGYKYANPLQLSDDNLVKNLKMILNYLLNEKYNANLGLKECESIIDFVILCVGHDQELVETFVKAGVEITPYTAEGCSLFQLAVDIGHANLLPFLAKTLPITDLLHRDLSGRTALSSLVALEDLHILRYCYGTLKLDINTPIRLRENLLLPPLSMAVCDNKLPVVALLLELGANESEIIQREDGLFSTTVLSIDNNLQLSQEMFTLLYSKFLCKKLSAKGILSVEPTATSSAISNAASNTALEAISGITPGLLITATTTFDPIKHLANFFSDYQPKVDSKGNLRLTNSQLLFTKYKVRSFIIPETTIFNFIREIELHYRTKNAILDLNVAFEELWEKTKENSFGNDTELEQISEKIVQRGLELKNKTEMILTEAYQQHSEIKTALIDAGHITANFVTQTESTSTAVIKADLSAASDIDPKKLTLQIQKVAALKTELDNVKKTFEAAYNGLQEFYSKQLSLLAEVSTYKNLETDRFDKLGDARMVVKTLDQKISHIKEIQAKIDELKEQMARYLTESLDIKKRYENRYESIYGKQLLQIEQQKINVEAVKRKAQLIEQQRKAALEQQEKERAATEARKAAWVLAKELAKKKREEEEAEAAERVKASRAAGEKLAEDRAGQSEDFVENLFYRHFLNKKTPPAKAKTAEPISLTSHLPLMLQKGVGDELEQLSAAVKALKVQNSEYNKTKEEGEVVSLIEIEFKRRTLLGLMARIMEHFVQRKLSPGLNVDLAEHFRDVVFHGNLFPDCTSNNIYAATCINDDIQKMAEKVLAFLGSKAQLKVQNWKEVSQKIDCPLFNNIVDAEIKEKRERTFYLNSIEKEKRLLNEIQQYREKGGLYVHLDNFDIILEHSIGFTYAILGACASKLKSYPKDFSRNKAEYSGYIEKGKAYRHVKTPENVITSASAASAASSATSTAIAGTATTSIAASSIASIATTSTTQQQQKAHKKKKRK